VAATLLVTAGCSHTPPPGTERPAAPALAKRPNFLLILADDLGTTDIGAFGGEIQTPNIDRLAKGGTQLTQFYASPFCSPTRAMLMSGADNHRAGFGDMAELMLDVQRGHDGYEGYLNQKVLAIPEVLKQAGYRTVMAGKWHLGNTEAQSPAARGFDRSYAMTMGGASHFGDQFGIFALAPNKPIKAMYRENGKAIDIPRQGFYSSEVFASRVIQYLDDTRGDGTKPFFAYLAFTAPHWPLHAPDEDIRKYEGRYDAGYDAIRQERLQRMKALGLVPADAQVYDGHPRWRKWATLSPDEKRSESKRMAVYAAMVDNMDRQIGRVLSHLEKTGELDNTVIVFLSDNGADGNSIYDYGRTREWIRKDMDNSVENAGREGSYIEYGPGWAQVGMTPLHLYKSFMYEGGIRVPAIVWGPTQGIPAQRRSHEVARVVDIAPTLYEMAGTAHPGTSYQDKKVFPVTGRSLQAFLRGERPHVYGPDDALGWELGGRKALRKGDWKIVMANAPWGSGHWELYNLANDPTEQRNLAAAQPAKLQELLVAWREYVSSNGVLEIEGLADRPGYSNAARYYEDLAYEAKLKPRAKP
jgi:arylsulfatase